MRELKKSSVVMTTMTGTTVMTSHGSMTHISTNTPTNRNNV
jgi:hypothetical protein